MSSTTSTSWPENITAQAFAWLDHCIERQLSFPTTINAHLRATTNKRTQGLAFTVVSRHMTAYGQSKNLDKPYSDIKKKLKPADHVRFMNDLLVLGTAMVPKLTGNTEIAQLIADAKRALAETREDGRDEVVANMDDRDNGNFDYEADDDISTDESSQSEYKGNSSMRLGTVPNAGKKRRRQPQEPSQTQLPPRKRARVGARSAQSSEDEHDVFDGGDSVSEPSQSEYMDDGPKRSGTGLNAGPKRRRLQSAPAESPPAKRARTSSQSAELLTDEQDELHDEMPSKESLATRILRHIYPSKASEKRQANTRDMDQEDEQEQRLPHSASMARPKIHQESQTPVVSQQEPPEISPLTSSTHTSQQDDTKVLGQNENLHVRSAVVPETPQGNRMTGLVRNYLQDPTLQEDFEDTKPLQESPQASTSFTAAPSPEVQESQPIHDPNQNQGFLARENARLHKLIIQKEAEIKVWKEANTSLLSSLSAPTNSERNWRKEYMQMCERFNSRERFQNRKHEAVQGFVGHQPSDLMRKFDHLQLEIHRACHTFALADSHQMMTMSSSEDGVGATLRDPKIRSLLETACGSMLKAWELRRYEDALTDLVRALVTAHVFRRIFESDFPLQYTGAHDSHLLTRYQRMWFHQDGAKELWIAERLALQDFVKGTDIADKNEPFHNLIEAKAREFANEIALLLAPLTPPHNILAGHLTHVYKAALRLKADTVLSNYTFTARFLRPGLSVNPEMEQCLDVEHSYSSNQDIKLILYPVIYIKPVREIDPLAAKVRDCKVDYKNFKVSTDVFWGAGELRDKMMLHKGMVVV
ncbi:hypothetical protein PG989_016282 [Apiospora arundinis]